MSFGEDKLIKLLAESTSILCNLGRFGDAETVLAGLRERRSSNPTVDLLDGWIQFGKGDYIAAEKCYRRGLDKATGDAILQAYLAETLIAQRRHREAESLLLQVSQNSSDKAAQAFAVSLTDALRLGALSA